MRALGSKMTAVGFEPTQLSLVELESTPLDHSGKLSWRMVQSSYHNSCSEGDTLTAMGICTLAHAAASEVQKRLESLIAQKNDTCGIRAHAGRPHRLSRPTP